MLRDAFYLAWRSLSGSPIRTTILVLGVCVALFLPLFTAVFASQLEERLLARARQTPLVVGPAGSAFDLVMGALYFRTPKAPGDGPPSMLWRELEGLAALRGAARPPILAPLHLRYSIEAAPLVGTTPDYFAARGLRAAEGRLPALLGEVVAGAAVASEFQLAVGDTVRSDLSNLYNLAGSYPIVLEVSGVLAATGSPDDTAFFTDVRTTWVIEGRLHGHQAVEAPQSDEGGVTEDAVIEASAAIFMFTEIDETNRASFHLHGDEGDGSLDAVLVFPRSQKQKDLLLGDLALHETRQGIEPEAVVASVLEIVTRVRSALFAYWTLVAVSTLLFFALIVALTARLRAPEFELMKRIGASRRRIASILAIEVGIIVVFAALLAALLVVLIGGVWWQGSIGV